MSIHEIGVEEGYTNLPVDPDDVLNGALGELKEVLIIGTMHDGTIYRSSSHSNIPNMLYDVEKCKLDLLRESDV